MPRNPLKVFKSRQPSRFGSAKQPAGTRQVRRIKPPRTERPRLRLSFSAFKDPAKRPRMIVWTGVAVLLLAALVIVALGVTSTKWFCAEGCHKVQDDTIIAYNRSTHSRVSCMACHMPVNADPITFVLHKAEALGELYLTLTDNFELPLNGESHVALEMASEQCTQCHNLSKRSVTPASGILIDHDIHADEGFGCTVCHNRVAHNEDFNLTLKNPGSGIPNRKHEAFMSMTACFRCHAQSADGRAPGTCAACHTKDFELKPASHREKSFYPEGHADLAQAEESRTARLERVASSTAEGEATKSESEDQGEGQHGEPLELSKVESINECSTCHGEKFCTDCHGVPMPHPGGFKAQHGKLGKRNPKSCSRCHGDPERFCDECHHGTSMGIPYVGTTGPWRTQHPAAVRALGASRCFECHEPTFCAHCHVRGIAR